MSSNRDTFNTQNSKKQTLTKSMMIDALTEQIGLNRREAKEIVALFFEEIRNALEAQQEVKLSGFGNFLLRYKRERPGRNLKTKQALVVSARHVVSFIPGKKFKQQIELENREDALSKNDRYHSDSLKSSASISST